MHRMATFVVNILRPLPHPLLLHETFSRYVLQFVVHLLCPLFLHLSSSPVNFVHPVMCPFGSEAVAAHFAHPQWKFRAQGPPSSTLWSLTETHRTSVLGLLVPGLPLIGHGRYHGPCCKRCCQSNDGATSRTCTKLSASSFSSCCSCYCFCNKIRPKACPFIFCNVVLCKETRRDHRRSGKVFNAISGLVLNFITKVKVRGSAIERGNRRIKGEDRETQRSTPQPHLSRI